MSQNEKCPLCDSKMIVRTNRKKGTKFWGCSQFPKCRGTRPYTNNVNLQPIAKRELKSIPNPSKYQKEIFFAIETLIHKNTYKDKKNLIVNAVAGSGKTTTEEHAVGLIKKHSPNAEIIYMVFNKKVEVEATQKGLPAKTTHSKFLNDLCNHLGKRPKIDNQKVFKIVKEFIDKDNFEEDKWMIPIVCKLVGMLKNTLAPTDNETQEKIADRFSIELNGTQDTIFEMVRQTLIQNNEDLATVDYDDMLYLTYKLGVQCKKYDWVLIDEAQDFNRSQLELMKRSIKSGGHALIVGDPYQSIYGFRGAALDAMDNLKESLDCYELPLSISYRCAKSHIALINTLFPEYKIEAWENAQEGSIEEMTIDRMLGNVQENDLVLCRNNAPLVKPAFSLIRQGKKAIILGRDIGQNLINLIEKFEKRDLTNTLYEVELYANKEIAKLLRLEKNSQAQTLEDKVNTIYAISDGCQEVWQLKKRIEEIFSDDKEGVIFSTVHKAKGSEADNVFILEPQLVPSKYAQKDWEIQQEKHIRIIDHSRSKDRLVFVGGPAPMIFLGDKSWDEEDEKIAEQVVKELELDKENVYTNVEFDLETVLDEKEQILAKARLSQKKIVPECPF